MAKAQKKIRILIADGETVLANKLASYLKESGFETKVMNNNYLLQKEILAWRPNYIFIDLMFPGFYAQECLQFLKKRNLLSKECRVIVTSSHNDPKNVKACIDEGAHDFLVKPLLPLEILNRLMLLLKSKDLAPLKLVGDDDPKIGYYFKMMDLLIKTTTHNKPVQNIRFELSQMLSLALKAVRTSVVEFNDLKNGPRVTCSSDDITLKSLTLDLKKYPELQYILRTEKALFIENIASDKSLAAIQEKVQSIHFNSMIVLPIHHGTTLVAALSIRMPAEYSKLAVWDIKVAILASQLLAMTWKFKTLVSAKKAS